MGRGSDSPFIIHRSSLIVFLSAFLAGLLYAFSSSKLFYAALGQFNIASSQWIPFAVLYVLRSGRPARGCGSRCWRRCSCCCKPMLS